jgi:integrase
MDLKQVQARLGHSSVKVTGDRYAHLYEGVTRRAVDALERLPSDNWPIDGAIDV